MFLWLGFTIALPTPHVVLQDNLAIAKEVLVMMASSIPWHLLIGSWLKRMVAKDIHFPQFLHPTLGYKAWLTTDMRSVRREEKDYRKSNKRKRTE